MPHPRYNSNSESFGVLEHFIDSLPGYSGSACNIATIQFQISYTYYSICEFKINQLCAKMISHIPSIKERRVRTLVCFLERCFFFAPPPPLWYICTAPFRSPLPKSHFFRNVKAVSPPPSPTHLLERRLRFAPPPPPLSLFSISTLEPSR